MCRFLKLLLCVIPLTVLYLLPRDWLPAWADALADWADS